MRIKKVEIRNFRGIKSLDWIVKEPIACLIGPGDSTKSTVLAAIEYALSPRWNISVDDSDFYNCDVANPIEIIVTVGEVQGNLLTEDKFGLCIRGWNSEKGLVDDPEGNDEQVLSIRLRITDELEPEWTAFKDANPDGRSISAKDREQFGVVRLGDFLERHFSWSRGSMLSRMTLDSGSSASSILTKVNRQARADASFDEVEELKQVIQSASSAAELLGVKSLAGYKPSIDFRSMEVGTGVIALHDGEVPFRLAGLGSRRLLALGVQLQMVTKGGILLIDEVETGLEPHRIRHLLACLKKSVVSENEQPGQVFLTSHSHTSIVVLDAKNICVVRNSEGEISINQVPDDLQGLTRGLPEAFLGRKVIVCEGATECGLCMSFDNYWATNGDKFLAHEGVVVVDSGGRFQERAIKLSHLGYQVCVFADSDKVPKWSPSKDDLETADIKVAIWGGETCTEKRIVQDVSWETLKKIVEKAVELRGEEGVFDRICLFMEKNRAEIGTDLDEWLTQGIEEATIREAIGKAANGETTKGEESSKAWFKRINLGQELGEILLEDIENFKDKDLHSTLEELREWAYAEQS